MEHSAGKNLPENTDSQEKSTENTPEISDGNTWSWYFLLDHWVCVCCESSGAAVLTDGQLSQVKHRAVSSPTATAEDGRRPGAGG